MTETMTTVVMVAAIILGPVLAIQVQKIIEHFTRSHDEKRKVFVTLLATRGRKMLPEHVQALNMIDLIFSEKGRFDRLFPGKRKKDQTVVEAWSLYRDHLHNSPEQAKPQADGKVSEVDAKDYKRRLDEWTNKSDDLLCTLLKNMAESLGHHFSDLLIKKGSYTPRGYFDVELEQMALRRGLLDVLDGIHPLPMTITGFPVDEEASKAMKQFLQGFKPLTVRMESSPEVKEPTKKGGQGI